MTNNVWKGKDGDFALDSNWSLDTDVGNDVINSGDATVESSETIGGVTSLSIGAAGGSTVDGELTVGSLVDHGSLFVDDSLTVTGALKNFGILTLGSASLAGAATVTAASLLDTGAINLSTGSAKTSTATLDIKSAAGLGTRGEITGTVSLAGNSTLEFASGRIATIATGASLDLTGADAFVDDFGGAADSALKGLTTNDGTLSLLDGASVALGGSLTNAGDLFLDASSIDYSAFYAGGSKLTVKGTLTNLSGDQIQIGNWNYGQAGMTANDTIAAGSLVNDGNIAIHGDSSTTDIISGAFTNGGEVGVASGNLKVTGAVTGVTGYTGVFYIGYYENTASLELDGAVAYGEDVNFGNYFYDSSGAEKLTLGDAAQFSADIGGFGFNDSVLRNEVIDVKHFGTGTKVAFADNVLTLTDDGATASLTFIDGIYKRSSFAITTNATDTIIKNA